MNRYRGAVVLFVVALSACSTGPGPSSIPESSFVPSPASARPMASSAGTLVGWHLDVVSDGHALDRTAVTTATAIPIIVSSPRYCFNGGAYPGLGSPTVTYSSTTVTITMRTAKAFPKDCSPVGWGASATVQLREPVGDRTLLDGSYDPAQARPIPAPPVATPDISRSVEPAGSAQAASLLVRVDGSDVYRSALGAVDYLSDGTVIRAIDGVLKSNALTLAGLAALRGRLADDADLLAAASSADPQAAPPTSWLEFHRVSRDNSYALVLGRPDGSRTTVSTADAGAFKAGKWVPDGAMIDRLKTLAKDLSAISGPGAPGLADRSWSPYQVTRVGVFVGISPNSNCDPEAFDYCAGVLPRDISGGWPFAGTPQTFGSAFGGPMDIRRCAFVPIGDVQAALSRLPHPEGQSLTAAGLASRVWTSGHMIWGADDPTTDVSVTVLALLPEDDSTSCADYLAALLK